jgi:hypothetical protein
MGCLSNPGHGSSHSLQQLAPVTCACFACFCCFFSRVSGLAGWLAGWLLFCLVWLLDRLSVLCSYAAFWLTLPRGS